MSLHLPPVLGVLFFALLVCVSGYNSPAKAYFTEQCNRGTNASSIAFAPSSIKNTLYFNPSEDFSSRARFLSHFTSPSFINVILVGFEGFTVGMNDLIPYLNKLVVDTRVHALHPTGHTNIHGHLHFYIETASDTLTRGIQDVMRQRVTKNNTRIPVSEVDQLVAAENKRKQSSLSIYVLNTRPFLTHTIWKGEETLHYMYSVPGMQCPVSLWGGESDRYIWVDLLSLVQNGLRFHNPSIQESAWLPDRTILPTRESRHWLPALAALLGRVSASVLTPAIHNYPPLAAEHRTIVLHMINIVDEQFTAPVEYIERNLLQMLSQVPVPEVALSITTHTLSLQNCPMCLAALNSALDPDSGPTVQFSSDALAATLHRLGSTLIDIPLPTPGTLHVPVYMFSLHSFKPVVLSYGAQSHVHQGIILALRSDGPSPPAQAQCRNDQGEFVPLQGGTISSSLLASVCSLVYGLGPPHEIVPSAPDTPSLDLLLYPLFAPFTPAALSLPWRQVVKEMAWHSTLHSRVNITLERAAHAISHVTKFESVLPHPIRHELVVLFNSFAVKMLLTSQRLGLVDLEKATCFLGSAEEDMVLFDELAYAAARYVSANDYCIEKPFPWALLINFLSLVFIIFVFYSIFFLLRLHIAEALENSSKSDKEY